MTEGDRGSLVHLSVYLSKWPCSFSFSLFTPLDSADDFRLSRPIANESSSRARRLIPDTLETYTLQLCESSPRKVSRTLNSCALIRRDASGFSGIRKHGASVGTTYRPAIGRASRVRGEKLFYTCPGARVAAQRTDANSHLRHQRERDRRGSTREMAGCCFHLLARVDGKKRRARNALIETRPSAYLYIYNKRCGKSRGPVDWGTNAGGEDGEMRAPY